MREAGSSTFDEALAQFVDEACRAHPGITVDRAPFTAFVRTKVAEAEPSDEPLVTLHGGDLFLAFACVERRPGATEALDASIRSDIEKVNANQRSLGLGADELRQLVLERILLRADRGPPRIASYSGKGPLRAWVRVAATRIAIDLGRKAGAMNERPTDGMLFDRLPGAGDPEMTYVRELYAPELQAAVEAGWKALSVRQRTVLRQRFGEQLGADAIATIHGVHRATVFGWIDGATKALVASVRAELRSRVRGSDETLDSVMALVARGVDISVGRLLSGGDDEGG